MLVVDVLVVVVIVVVVIVVVVILALPSPVGVDISIDPGPAGERHPRNPGLNFEGKHYSFPQYQEPLIHV